MAINTATAVPLLDSRSELLTRTKIPHIILSDGNGTPTLATLTSKTTHNGTHSAAEERFAVRGNAIITGGLGTLGMAAGIALLEHGLSGIMVLDKGLTHLQDNLISLRTSFPTAKIEALEVDVTDEIAVTAAVELTAQLLGSIDHLLCFAGIVGCVHALETPISQWRRILDINTTGSFICAQACAKQMILQGSGGSIIFTASISAHRTNYPQPQAAYNVSKAALLSLKGCLAAEWARYGIRTNSISPGYMNTVLNEGEALKEARDYWVKRNPMGRMGEPEELTGAVVMLASGTYLNGIDIVVDGGQLLLQ